MRNHEEDKIVAELEQEFSSKEGLVALVVCFGLTGWMVLMAAFNVAAVV